MNKDLSEVVEIKTKDDQDSIIQGVAVGISLIITGIILLFSPGYLGNELVTNIFAYVTIFFGMFGVGTELNKLNGDKSKFGLDDFVIGVAFIALWMWAHSSFDYLIVNLLILSILFFGLMFVITGTIHFFIGIFQSQNKKSIFTKIILTLVNIFTGLAVLYESLQKFGLLDKF